MGVKTAKENGGKFTITIK